MTNVNRRDVAKLAGVSEATVSRVFNNVTPLREETKRKVLQAAESLGYYPNAIAQSFASGKSGNIGVVVPYLPKVRMFSTHYFSEILSGIGLKLAEEDYGLLLLFTDANATTNYEKLFQSQKVDACIILGAQDLPGEREALTRLKELKLPYCLVNQRFEGDSFHVIDGQHEQGSYDAVSYLIETGHKRIAFLNGPMSYSNSLDRLKGYERALCDHQLPIDANLQFSGNYSRTSGQAQAAEIGKCINEIDAIFVANDRMAIGLMQGLTEQGYVAGKDYSLIGYDDSDFSRYVHPQLSSVKVPLFEMGMQSAEVVLHMISTGDTKEIYNKQLPVSLVKRHSIIERG